jgi:hypothetical protein
MRGGRGTGNKAGRASGTSSVGPAPATRRLLPPRFLSPRPRPTPAHPPLPPRFPIPSPRPSARRRLLTDADPALRDRLIQVLFQNNKFQWARLTNLIQLAKEGTGGSRGAAAAAAGALSAGGGGAGGLDLSETVRDAVRLVMTDAKLRGQLVEALTEDNRLHVDEVAKLLALLGSDVDPARVVQRVVADLPTLSRQVMLSWADRVLVS